MTEEGYKGGLVSRVKNKTSGKKYVISTAQEIRQDYWSIVVFPAIMFGLLPNISKKILVLIRNNKDSAHQIHWEIKNLVLNYPENEWLEKIPSPEPPDGYSVGAREKLKERGIE